MSSVNTCPTTPRSGRSPETGSDWVYDNSMNGCWDKGECSRGVLCEATEWSRERNSWMKQNYPFSQALLAWIWIRTSIGKVLPSKVLLLKMRSFQAQLFQIAFFQNASVPRLRLMETCCFQKDAVEVIIPWLLLIWMPGAFTFCNCYLLTVSASEYVFMFEGEYRCV